MSKFLTSNITSIALLVFLLTFELLQQNSVLPASTVIVESAKSLYLASPLVWLGLGAFVSTLVYVNLYVPGPIIIFAAVLSTNGTLSEFVFISCVVTMAAVIACLCSNLLGQKTSADTKRITARSWLLGHSSLYTLGFWYHRTHFTRKELCANIALTAIFLLPYSVVICYILHPLGGGINQNTNLYLIGALVLYLVYMFCTTSRLFLRQK